MEEASVVEEKRFQTKCRPYIRPNTRAFCDPKLRKVRVPCKEQEPIQPCLGKLQAAPSQKFLGPVTLKKYSPSYDIDERVALVEAMKRRRGRLLRDSMKSIEMGSLEEESSDDLWDVSDFDYVSIADPAVLNTKRKLSEAGCNYITSPKCRSILKEALKEPRLAEEVFKILEKEKFMRNLDINPSIKKSEIHKMAIKEILENNGYLHEASRSIELRKLAKALEEDKRVAQKLTKCTEILKIIEESKRNSLLKKKILEMSMNKKREYKKKAKWEPMSPWVDHHHWFDILTHIKDSDPSDHIEPYLFIDWAMERKTSAMYKSHREFAKKVDRNMLHDFVQQLGLLVTTEGSENAEETLKKVVSDYDIDSSLSFIDEEIAKREEVLNEIEGMKGYLEKIEKFDGDQIDINKIFQKQTQTPQLWDFETFFTNNLHPMNASELLEEAYRQKVILKEGERFAERERVAERSSVFNKYARLFVERGIPTESKTEISKSEVDFKIEEQEVEETELEPSREPSKEPSEEKEISEENASDTNVSRYPSLKSL